LCPHNREQTKNRGAEKKGQRVPIWTNSTEARGSRKDPVEDRRRGLEKRKTNRVTSMIRGEKKRFTGGFLGGESTGGKGLRGRGKGKKKQSHGRCFPHGGHGIHGAWKKNTTWVPHAMGGMGGFSPEPLPTSGRDSKSGEKSYRDF